MKEEKGVRKRRNKKKRERKNDRGRGRWRERKKEVKVGGSFHMKEREEECKGKARRVSSPRSHQAS